MSIIRLGFNDFFQIMQNAL